MMKSTQHSFTSGVLVSLVLVLGLVPAPVLSQYSAPPFLKDLLAIPWGEASSALPSPQSWKETVNGTWESDHPLRVVDDGRVVRQFKQEKSNATFIMNTHMQPSITDNVEFLSWGTIRYEAPSADGAKRLNQALVHALQNNGFQVESSLPAKGFDWHEDVWDIQSSNRRGKLYTQNLSVKSSMVIIELWHPDYETFFRSESADVFGQKLVWQMPDRLIHDLEKAEIELILGKEDWELLKTFSAQETSYDVMVLRQQTSLRRLINLYTIVGQVLQGHSNSQPFWVLQNYLAEYMLHRRGIDGEERLSKEEIQWLAEQDIQYYDSHFSGSYYASPSRLVYLGQYHLDTYWGQWASIRMIQLGWKLNVDFGPNRHQTREKSLAFLRSHPNSPFAPDVLFYLGNVEETEWNIDYQHSTGLKYRDKAIHYYEQVLQSPRSVYYADHLSHVLPRLRAGYPSGNMLYWCFCD